VGEVGKLGREDDRVRDTDDERDLPTFDEGTSVVVLAPGSATGVERALLTPPDPSTDHGLLAIGVTSDPAKTVERYTERLQTSPGPRALVRVGRAGGEGGPADATVDRVREPANLTGLGTTVMRAVEDWEPGWRAWFDSIDPLVHHTSIAKVCQFTDVFAGRLAREGATTFVRLDPAIHDERTVHRLMGAFDAAVWDERAEDGEDWRIRRR
jgi:hypothetical protein